MKAMLFAFLLVLTLAWTFALEAAVNPQKILANHPGVKTLRQWVKEHGLAPAEIEVETANLRGMKLEESVAAMDNSSPRFLYTGAFLTSNDCTGPMVSMFAYRFDFCQPFKMGSSFKLVYDGLQNGQHVASMQSFSNANCEGAPVASSPMGGFSASCSSFTNSFVVDELPGLEAFVKYGARFTITNEKKDCQNEAKRGKDIPDENIREMFFGGMNSCMNMGDKDSMLVGCTKNGVGSASFEVREYNTDDTSCTGSYTVATTTTADFCKRKRDTIFGTGYGHMNWSCNNE